MSGLSTTLGSALSGNWASNYYAHQVWWHGRLFTYVVCSERAHQAPNIPTTECVVRQSEILSDQGISGSPFAFASSF